MCLFAVCVYGFIDKAAPTGLTHRAIDVLPFIYAAQLDGNSVEPNSFLIPDEMLGKIQFLGPNLANYFNLRPAIVPGTTPLSPGQCQP